MTRGLLGLLGLFVLSPCVGGEVNAFIFYLKDSGVVGGAQMNLLTCPCPFLGKIDADSVED